MTKRVEVLPPGESMAAYQKIEPELAALTREQVGRVTADIPNAVSLALGAEPGIRALVPEMKNALKNPPLAQVARLRERALALLHAHHRWVPASTKLDEELAEATALRAQLLTAAEAHVVFGQLDADAVANIRSGQGLLDRATDLVALGALFRRAWPTIGKRTPVSEAQIDRALVLGPTILAGLGAKELGYDEARAAEVNWADQRARAFRLFMQDYEEIRRAVEYLRYHQEDGDSFTPSLHPRRRGRAAPVVAPVDPATPADGG